MKIEMLDEFHPEYVYYKVDGRDVEVPQEDHFHDKNDLDDFTTYFYVSQSVDRNSKEPVSQAIRKAIAQHIKEGCEDDDIKYKIILD